LVRARCTYEEDEKGDLLNKCGEVLQSRLLEQQQMGLETAYTYMNCNRITPSVAAG
jgi:hypothetical protein